MEEGSLSQFIVNVEDEAKDKVKNDVKNDDLTEKDMMSLVQAAYNHNGISGHNIRNYNKLIGGGLAQVLQDLFQIERSIRNERAQVERAGDSGGVLTTFTIKIQFSNISVGKPKCTTFQTGQIVDLYPIQAQLTGVSYSGAVTSAATVTIIASYSDGRTEEKVAEIPPFHIGNFPTMVKGVNCHLAGLTQEALRGLGENPKDHGGYFIIGRDSMQVDPLENIRYNAPHIHKAVKPNEFVRVEMISQPPGSPFENSTQSRILLTTKGAITIGVTSTKLGTVNFPFWLIYRMLGMTSDKAIVETIVFNIDDKGPVTTQMLEIIEGAFRAQDPIFGSIFPEMNREKIIEMTAEKVLSYIKSGDKYHTSDEAVRYTVLDLLGDPSRSGGLDKILLPHIGLTPDFRMRKLRFLGLMIRRMLLVHLGLMAPTDRDSPKNKRCIGPGTSVMKAWKTQMNKEMIKAVLASLRRELRSNEWDTVTPLTITQAMLNALNPGSLTSMIERAIKMGNGELASSGPRQAVRLSSTAREAKNMLNLACAGRQIATAASTKNVASKGSTRAENMRSVRPNSNYFICPAHSPDTGEKVGMNKQLAITASICDAGELLPLKRHIAADPDVLPPEKVTNREIQEKNLSRIFVNGEWVGVCLISALEFAARYRALRRAGQAVDRHTTIYWDPETDEIEFWLDEGRLWCPMLIVYNNIEAYDEALRARHKWAAAHGGSMEGAPPRVEFTQNIRFTKAHAQGIREGKITLSDLHREGVVDYVTPEEMENFLVAESIKVLRDRRHDVTMQYTHCGVEQALFGLAAHLSPYGNHTQPARVTYQTNQSRQTCGWYAPNFIEQFLKNRFWQFYNSQPLVYTITNQIVPPNGANVIVAIMSCNGNNQEDSAQVSRAAIERGLFNGVYYTLEIVELNKGESFRNPDALITEGLRPSARYEKLKDGFISVGAHVEKNDVLVGRVAKITREAGSASGKDRYQFTDRSVIYSSQEPGVVEAVLRLRGPNDEPFVIVKLRHGRPLNVGDKLSSRSGNKCLTGEHLVLSRVSGVVGWRRIDDLVENGAAADIELATGGGCWTRPTAYVSYTGSEAAETFDVHVEVDGSAPSVLCRATADHRLVLQDGTLRKVRDLRAGDLLSPFNAEKIRFIEAVSAGRKDVYCFEVPGEKFVVSLGDAPMHWTGNSIVAERMSQSDLPFTESGLTPDIIINPHSMPSRMTIGQLIEMLVSKACARLGTVVDGTAFLPVDYEKITKEMLDLGFRANGRERLYNGITGEYIDSAIFIGPMAEQRLQKFVIDDKQSSGGSVATDATTGQPVKGKDRGGLRLGEMEMWTLAAHGAFINVDAKARGDSDGRDIHVCRNCGNLAIYNEFNNIYACRPCGEQADISVVKSSKSSVLVIEELAASGIGMQLQLQPRQFEAHMSGSRSA